MFVFLLIQTLGSSYHSDILLQRQTPWLRRKKVSAQESFVRCPVIFEIL